MASLTPAGSRTGSASDQVAVVYRAYVTLNALAQKLGRADLEHILVLCEPLAIGGEAPMIAASIVSAASLCVESNGDAVRQSIRSGAIDFAVNSLDEALRAIKNEVRKGLSIAVCLEGDPERVLPEMVERGVQPDVLCCSGLPGAQLAMFVERGAHLAAMGSEHKDPECTDTTWRVSALPGKWLPVIDAMVSSVLPVEDSVRQSWLKRAPRYLGRSMRVEHFLPLRREEVERVRDALAGQDRDVAVVLGYGGEQIEFAATTRGV